MTGWFSYFVSTGISILLCVLVVFISRSYACEPQWTLLLCIRKIQKATCQLKNCLFFSSFWGLRHGKELQRNLNFKWLFGRVWPHLVHLFKQMFSVFKQYYMYFYTFFYLHIFLYIFLIFKYMYQILLLFSLIYSVQVINCRILKSKAFT